MNPSGTGAPFRERSNWAQLITTVVIYGAMLIAILSAPSNAFLTAVLLAAAGCGAGRCPHHRAYRFCH